MDSFFLYSVKAKKREKFEIFFSPGGAVYLDERAGLRDYSLPGMTPAGEFRHAP